jgi:hypothetical protein
MRDEVEAVVTGQVSGSTESVSGEEQRRPERRHRASRGPHGEELRVELRLARIQRRTLAISTALLIVGCCVLGFWALSEQASLNAAVSRKQAQIEKLTEQLAAATTEVEESRRAVDSLVAGRIPGLLPFRVDEVLSVDTPFVREISFKPPAAPGSGYECKLVVENDSSSEIRPALSARVFDDVGIQLAHAQLMDGARDALRPDEIRSFFASLEIAKGKVPRYFMLTSD